MHRAQAGHGELVAVGVIVPEHRHLARNGYPGLLEAGQGADRQWLREGGYPALGTWPGIAFGEFDEGEYHVFYSNMPAGIGVA